MAQTSVWERDYDVMDPDYVADPYPVWDENCLAPAVGDEFVAMGRVTEAGRKQVFTSGELHARRDGSSKLDATANTLLVPSGVAIGCAVPSATEEAS